MLSTDALSLLWLSKETEHLHQILVAHCICTFLDYKLDVFPEQYLSTRGYKKACLNFEVDLKILP